MEKIPTAEEHFEGMQFSQNKEYNAKLIQEVAKKSREHTELHVKAALEAASIKANAKGEGTGGLNTDRGNLYWTYAGNIGKVIIDKDSILNAYPLDKIQ